MSQVSTLMTWVSVLGTHIRSIHPFYIFPLPPQRNAWGIRKWFGLAWIEGILLDSSWNVMAHGDAREGKWRGTWRMEWVASTLHTTSERDVSSITTADAHTSAASSRLNWPPPGRLKWTRPFRRNTKSGFCACPVIFQLASKQYKCLWQIDSSWNVLAHGNEREGKWRGNWRMEWVASTLHTTSEHGVSSITTADAHTSAASSRVNWRPSPI